MADELTTVQRLRGLVFSAEELHSMDIFPPEFIEDYLSLIDNIGLIANEVDEKQNILRNVANITFAQSPFTVDDVDTEYTFDTTDGNIICLLLAGVDGRIYRMTNVGTAGNRVLVLPVEPDTLYGSANESIYDAETFDMTYGTVQRWW